MADPVVHITAGIPDSGTGNITTLGQTLTDGANATMGITSGAAVVTDANGTLQQYLRGLVKLFAGTVTNANGAAASAASAPVVPATDWVGTTSLSKFGTGYYVTVAASQTATVLQSSSGATGDYISGVLVIPATTSPGNVLLLDNATSITIFTGGSTSVSNLVPFLIPLGAVSRSGAWKLTTGANVSCVAVGKFS
jgi:hypothetical protein